MIGTTRFSVPGFPCLYLACSSYLCNLEVQKKSTENQIVSRYELWNWDYKNPEWKKNNLNYWNSYYGRVDKVLQNAKTYNVTHTIEDYEFVEKPTWNQQF